MIRPQNNESADEYANIVIQLDLRNRIVRYRHDLQWIIQRRSSPDVNKSYWVGQSYHTSWESLTSHYSHLALPRCPNQHNKA